MTPTPPQTTLSRVLHMADRGATVAIGGFLLAAGCFSLAVVVRYPPQAFYVRPLDEVIATVLGNLLMSGVLCIGVLETYKRHRRGLPAGKRALFRIALIALISLMAVPERAIREIIHWTDGQECNFSVLLANLSFGILLWCAAAAVWPFRKPPSATRDGEERAG